MVRGNVNYLAPVQEEHDSLEHQNDNRHQHDNRHYLNNIVGEGGEERGGNPHDNRHYLEKSGGGGRQGRGGNPKKLLLSVPSPVLSRSKPPEKSPIPGIRVSGYGKY